MFGFYRNSPSLELGNTEDGMVIDAAMGINFHIPWAMDSSSLRILFRAASLLTFGAVFFGGRLINSVKRIGKSDHLVNLNCWVQGPGKTVRNVRIKVARDKDRTWRRIECNRLFESDSDDLFSQSDVHGRSGGGRVYFPHQIKYKKSKPDLNFLGYSKFI